MKTLGVDELEASVKGLSDRRLLSTEYRLWMAVQRCQPTTKKFKRDRWKVVMREVKRRGLVDRVRWDLRVEVNE